MELLINSNSNSWEILLTIAIAIVPKMSIAIVISILLISSGLFIVHHIKLLISSISNFRIVSVNVSLLGHNRVCIASSSLLVESIKGTQWGSNKKFE